MTDDGGRGNGDILNLTFLNTHWMRFKLMVTVALKVRNDQTNTAKHFALAHDFLPLAI